MSEMIKEREHLVWLSKVHAMLLVTLNSYLFIFTTKYVVNSNDTMAISIVSTIATLVLLLTRMVANKKNVRRYFSTYGKLMTAVWIDAIGTSILILMYYHSTVWFMAVWVIFTGATNAFLSYLFRDRTLSIFKGPDLMDRENKVGNVALIAGLLGSAIAAILPIDQLFTIAIWAVVLYLLDAAILIYYTKKVHQFMDEYGIQTCSNTDDDKEE